MAATGPTTLKSGMLGTSRLASANPMRAKAAGNLLGAPEETDSHIGELWVIVLVEILILALLRRKFSKYHGG